MIKKVYGILSYLFYMFFLLISFGEIWVYKTWKHLTMDQLMYQISVSAVGTSSDIIISALLWILGPTIMLVLLWIWLEKIVSKKRLINWISFFVRAVFTCGNNSICRV